MPTAYSILPDRFEDGRHEAIKAGLRRAGYTVIQGHGVPRDERDVLVTWTVHRGAKEDAARAFEAAGGRVIVCEEAYFRIVGGEKCFALALHDHNGAGRWRIGGPERWAGFGIALRPWRAPGRHIVVREQRGIGSSVMASPPMWHDQVIAEIRKRTDRPAVLRFHPKSRMYRNEAAAQPGLMDQLEGAHAMVTWASADAVAALAAGVPVFYRAPHWICEGAARHCLDDIETPFRADRLPAFERLAWAQWRRGEIETGEAFKWLRG